MQAGRLRQYRSKRKKWKFGFIINPFLGVARRDIDI